MGSDLGRAATILLAASGASALAGAYVCATATGYDAIGGLLWLALAALLLVVGGAAGLVASWRASRPPKP